MTANTSALATHRSRRRVFVVTFALLGLANALCTIIGWFYSVDVKGWWQLILGVSFSMSFLFAGALYRLRSLSLLRAVVVSSALAVALLAHTCLYYLDPPNWLAVNNGQVVLTPIQTIVFSHYAFYALYALSLGLAIVLAHVPSFPRTRP